MLEIVKSGQKHRVETVFLGSGMSISQDAAGETILDLNPSAAITQEQADIRYVNIDGDTMTGTLTAPSFRSTSGGGGIGAGVQNTTGFIRMQEGGGANIGYIEWYTPAGVRQGYMGFGSGGVNMVAEVGAFNLAGGPTWTTSGWMRVASTVQGAMLQFGGTGRQYSLGNSLGILYGMTTVGETAGEAASYWMRVDNLNVNFLGQLRVGAYAGPGTLDGDITARRSANTGAYYFGDANDKYLYYDSTNFTLSGGRLLVAGFQMLTGLGVGNYIDGGISTHGTINVVGSYNGYAGIRFQTADRTMMVSGDVFGIYEASPGWLWLFHHDTVTGSTQLQHSQQFLALKPLNSPANGGIRFYNTAATVKGYVFWDANSFGLLYSDGNWRVQGTSSGGTLHGNWSASVTFTSVEIYATEWFRNSTAGRGLYNEATAGHFYSSSGTAWILSASGSSVSLGFFSNNITVNRGAILGNSDGVGILFPNGNWAVRAGAAAGSLLAENWSLGKDLFINVDGRGYGLVGVYDPSVWQAIFSMGTAYRLTAGGGAGNLYGLAWGYDMSGYVLNTGYSLSHGLAFFINGVVGSYVSASGIWTNGLLRVNGNASVGGTMHVTGALYEYGEGDAFYRVMKFRMENYAPTTEDAPDATLWIQT